MRVKFKKTHLENDAGAIGYVEDSIGEYLIRMGVVEKDEPKPQEVDEIRKGYQKEKKKK